MTKQIPYDLIPASDLPRSTPGAFDSVVGVDESTGAARRFPMPVTGAPKAYETRADLPASASEGTAAYVNNDPTPANNGLWAYLDGAWVQSADRVTGLEGRVASLEPRAASLEVRAFHHADELMRQEESLIGAVTDALAMSLALAESQVALAAAVDEITTLKSQVIALSEAITYHHADSIESLTFTSPENGQFAPLI